MIKSFIRNMRANAAMNTQAQQVENKRVYPRRDNDRCISEIDGKRHPVEDWSFGGLRLIGDFRTYTVGQSLPITVKFKLQDQIMRIHHAATVVRRSGQNMALQFEPLTQDMRTNFQKVVDDFNAQEFASSQA
ncbi:MAG: pilus assembly protein PilZ [Micavibrio sp.]|nr:pilus assembly protein PilZ [Micavibrio sp.]